MDNIYGGSWKKLQNWATGLFLKKTADSDLDMNGYDILNIKGTDFRINSMGDGYIRYENGLQICWGIQSFTFAESAWGELYLYKSEENCNFPTSFSEIPSLFMSATNQNTTFGVLKYYSSISAFGSIQAWRATSSGANLSATFDYIAIGKWK